MNKPYIHIQNAAKDTIKEAEALNIRKTEYSTEIKEKLLTCPSKWVQITKNFIKKFDDNISSRKRLTYELREAITVANIPRIMEIFGELGELDDKDKIACNIYNANLNEW